MKYPEFINRNCLNINVHAVPIILVLLIHMVELNDEFVKYTTETYPYTSSCVMLYV